MGLSLDTPINFDVLLVNTFITQLPVVFGELGRISLAGVFERRFVISIATFELWLRETIVVFFCVIWGTNRCFVNNTLYSHAVSFQRAVFRFITVAGTWWGDSLFLRLQDPMVMTTDDWSHVCHPTTASWSSGKVLDSGLGSMSSPGFNTLPVRPLVVPLSKALCAALLLSTHELMGTCEGRSVSCGVKLRVSDRWDGYPDGYMDCKGLMTREGTCQSLQSRALSLDVDSKQWLYLLPSPCISCY